MPSPCSTLLDWEDIHGAVVVLLVQKGVARLGKVRLGLVRLGLGLFSPCSTLLDGEDIHAAVVVLPLQHPAGRGGHSRRRDCPPLAAPFWKGRTFTAPWLSPLCSTLLEGNDIHGAVVVLPVQKGAARLGYVR